MREGSGRIAGALLLSVATATGLLPWWVGYLVAAAWPRPVSLKGAT